MDATLYSPMSICRGLLEESAAITLPCIYKDDHFPERFSYVITACRILLDVPTICVHIIIGLAIVYHVCDIYIHSREFSLK